MSVSWHMTLHLVHAWSFHLMELCYSNRLWRWSRALPAHCPRSKLAAVVIRCLGCFFFLQKLESSHCLCTPSVRTNQDHFNEAWHSASSNSQLTHPRHRGQFNLLWLDSRRQINILMHKTSQGLYLMQKDRADKMSKAGCSFVLL